MADLPRTLPHAFLAICLIGTPLPAAAQEPVASSGCATSASKAEPATAPSPDSRDGTSPGNSGSTGWSGGTGGAYIGTNPQGATEHSQTWQPPTARGLDLVMNAPATAQKPAAGC
jgi:hypothetical protein